MQERFMQHFAMAQAFGDDRDRVSVVVRVRDGRGDGVPALARLAWARR